MSPAFNIRPLSVTRTDAFTCGTPSGLWKNEPCAEIPVLSWLLCVASLMKGKTADSAERNPRAILQSDGISASDEEYD